jgi:hypothetical protein
MIAACYTADLYCDCEKCQTTHWEMEKLELTGNSWSQVARQARRSGWRVSKDRQRCYAPGHKIRRKLKDYSGEKV